MAERRIELRISDKDALWPILGPLPGRQRNAIVRAAVEAAFLPGGWASAVEKVQSILGAAPASPTAEAAHAPGSQTTDGADGMSTEGVAGFLKGLDEMGALG